jgi:hypothetical protein
VLSEYGQQFVELLLVARLVTGHETRDVAVDLKRIVVELDHDEQSLVVDVTLGELARRAAVAGVRSSLGVHLAAVVEERDQPEVPTFLFRTCKTVDVRENVDGVAPDRSVGVPGLRSYPPHSLDPARVRGDRRFEWGFRCQELLVHGRHGACAATPPCSR